MNQLLIKAQKITGIDGAVFYRLCATALSILTGPITLVLITMYFSLEEQGVYYTFVSLTALQVFFELGLTGIITQYTAHEVAHLRILPDRILVGPERNLSRLASLFTVFTKWFIVAGILLVVFLVITGWIFFTRNNTDLEIKWQLPWVVLSVGTGLFLILNMFPAFFEGFGYVKEMAKIRLWTQFAAFAGIAVCFLTGHGLYALGCAAFIRCILIGVALFAGKYHVLSKQLLQMRQTEIIPYWREVFPYQWKISVSWLSGYLIFNLFNPILFAYCGAKAAGQMGMTTGVVHIITGISTAWINTKIPAISMLIAKNDYKKLDGLFKKTLFQELVVSASIAFGFIACLWIAKRIGLEYKGVLLNERFLPISCCACFVTSAFLNILAFSFATYLRCHKQEPFLWNSVVTGIVVALSSLLCAKYSGVFALCLSYLIITVFTNVWGYLIYTNKKKAWHHV